MKTYVSALALAFVLLSGCDNGSQVAGPGDVSGISFNKDKPSKKCESCGYTVVRDFYNVAIINPEQVTVAIIRGEDIGYVYSIAREGDALYLTNHYGQLLAFDLSSPTNPTIRWSNNYSYGWLSNVRIMRHELIADSSVNSDEDPSSVVTWSIKRDPFNPELISFVPNATGGSTKPVRQ